MRNQLDANDKRPRPVQDTKRQRAETRLDVDANSASDEEPRLARRPLSGESNDDADADTNSSPSVGVKPRTWWDRVFSFGIKRKRQQEEEMVVDQDLYMRTILESYSSSLSSNRYSSVYMKDRLSAGPMRSVSRRTYTDEHGVVYVAQPETPNADEIPKLGGVSAAYDEPVEATTRESQENDETILEDEEEKKQRRIQRRITQDAIRAKLLQRNQHRARTRKKLLIFAVCIGLTLTAFIGAAMVIANAGVNVKARVNTERGIAERAKNSTGASANATITTPAPTTVAPTTTAPTPTQTSIPGGTPKTGVNVGDESGSQDEETLMIAGASGSSSSGDLPPPFNGTLAPLAPRDGLGFFTPKPANGTEAAGQQSGRWSQAVVIYTYAHCLLMSLSLWLSLVVIGMHMTFRSFRTYSMPLVLELSIVQTGYWITSLLRVQFTSLHMSQGLSLAFCLAECFFNFGQISFTCAIAFNMYRSVVSYADVLMDTQSASRRYRSYTINVMLLSALASITLALVGFRGTDVTYENFELCLYPTCRLILYVYYPLLAFGFNFVFYIRFKRTIGGAYPMSATGRLNKIARSYLLLFVVCWGSLITLTALRDTDIAPQTVLFILQCIFDVLGVGTAVITLTNFHRCRRAFDFGLLLKAIDPRSIEFEEPLQILGEGTFALVLRAKWHQRTLESSVSTTIDVAVKTFKHTQFETLEQMKEEAYLACKLVHPCVMMTYGCYTIGNNLYIVSEYLGGGTLQDVIDTTDHLPYERVLRYAHMIAMGMRFLHGLPVPIIHRDLKPLNCIFDGEKEMLKLADFGESRLFRKDGVIQQRPNFFPSFDLTLQMTTNIGSACWAAPEVLQDEAKTEYSLKVDVYSFGIICWQLFTCKVPYMDIPGSVLAIAEAVMGGRRPEIPDDCPTLFSKIMRRCWHQDPVRRPNFEDIVQLLEMEMSDLNNPRTPRDTKSPMLKTRSARKIQQLTPKSD